jgi:hypothetical protein
MTTIVPRNNNAIDLICNAVLNNEYLNIDTFKVVESYDRKTGIYTDALCVVYLKDEYKHDLKKPFISIWFNADENMTNGGRAVEAGFGPNYYETVDELKSAIETCIDQLLNGNDYDDVYDDVFNDKNDG